MIDIDAANQAHMQRGLAWLRARYRAAYLAWREVVEHPQIGGMTDEEYDASVAAHDAAEEETHSSSRAALAALYHASHAVHGMTEGERCAIAQREGIVYPLPIDLCDEYVAQILEYIGRAAALRQASAEG